MHRHKAGPLKQHNKKFKAKFASKGSLRKAAKGRVGASTAPSGEHRGNVRAGAVPGAATREERRQTMRAASTSARESLFNTHRVPATAAARFVLFVALGDSSDALASLSLVHAHCTGSADPSAPLLPRERLPARVRCPTCPRLELELSCGDPVACARSADHVVFVADAEAGGLLDAEAEGILSCLKAQGVPDPMFAVRGLAALPTPKKRREALALTREMFERHFPDIGKVHALDAPADAGALVRALAAQLAPRAPVWRDTLAYAMVDSAERAGVPGEARLVAHVRGGAGWSAKQLVHLPGVGTFQVARVADAASGVTIDESVPGEREPLVSENVPEEQEDEQTWPTAEELAVAEARRKRKKLVPKGTSSYQAAWLDENEMADGEDAEADAMDDGEDDKKSSEAVQGEDDTKEGSEEGEQEEQEEEEELEELQEDDAMEEDGKEEAVEDHGDDDGLEKKWRESREDAEFPDEVDTPTTIPARLRFQKYRGLKSFRTSPWDPNQNLPLDYGRIFQLANYRRTAKRILADHGPVVPGMHVAIYLADVSDEALGLLSSWDRATEPLVLQVLRKHENRTSVVHWQVRRHPTFEEPIRSRESLIFQFGFRSVPARPLFSEFAQGVAKQKMMRYWQPGAIACATMYGPIVFPPSPLLVFKQAADGSKVLVGTGSLLTVDASRIVCKKIVLTGFPFKITKKRAVVRAMFYNPEDIEWFKPVELWTKHGRRGNITESIGTHGYMRCTFDGPLKANDTICMSLYKRVFPKWVLPPQCVAQAHEDAEQKSA